MIRLVRIAKLVWAMTTRTADLARRADRMGEAESLQFRAHRQQVGCKLLCDILGIQVHTEGTLPQKQGMLVVSNHFGVLDPLILASVIPVSFVGKAELKDWPFIGWVSVTHGLVLVDRGRRTTAVQLARQVRARLGMGVHVLVFPEGTTSPGEDLLPFKTGVFEAVSGQEDAQILPVHLSVDAVEGEPATAEVRKRVVWADPDLPFLKHAWDLAGLRRTDMTVRIGEPIETAGRDRKELAQVAREAVERLRAARKQSVNDRASLSS